MSSAAPTVEIVVPVHNEEAVLADSIRRLHDYLTDALPVSWRIVIADNASTDATPRVAQALAEDLPGVQLLALADKGRGRALRAAWERSGAEVVCYMDVDLSTDLRALPPLLGGNTQSLTEALAYVKQHGGGTIAVSSQSGAAGQLITNGADVAAIGGFSGRESQVSVSWLADAVEQGRIRWVLTDGSSGGFQDGRIGASLVMDAVQEVGTQSGSVSGLYDLKGHADELRALAS